VADDDWVEVEVVGVRTHLADDELVLLLLDPSTARLVPILIGPAEAGAIAAAQAGAVSPRPMTHDLLRDALRAAGASVRRVEITGLLDGVFHAALVLDNGRRVDSRASDAVATALRFACPVMCAVDVVETAGVEVRTAPGEDDIAEFREFLDHVSAEDFAAEDVSAQDGPVDETPDEASDEDEPPPGSPSGGD